MKDFNAIICSPSQSKPNFYRRWLNMRYRCSSPACRQYRDYGGRGITVCDRWQEFAAFYEDMYPTYRPGMQLDRIDNDAGYSPENCRWVTASQNTRNRRTNRWVETPDGPMVLAEAAEKYGINRNTLGRRVQRGVDLKIIFSKQDLRRAA
jgi:hypothetical protein